jgi:hypothetical protein
MSADELTELTSGAVAGFVGTFPMTFAMEKMFHGLPQHEKYPLPATRSPVLAIRGA